MAAYPINVTVGSAGALIEGDDGMRLTIPRNAFTSNVNVHIDPPYADRPPAIPGILRRSNGFEITPHNQGLAVAGTLVLPIYAQYWSEKSILKLYTGPNINEADPNGWFPQPDYDDGRDGYKGGHITRLNAAFLGHT